MKIDILRYYIKSIIKIIIFPKSDFYYIFFKFLTGYQNTKIKIYYKMFVIVLISILI